MLLFIVLPATPYPKVIASRYFSNRIYQHAQLYIRVEILCHVAGFIPGKNPSSLFSVKLFSFEPPFSVINNVIVPRPSRSGAIRVKLKKVALHARYWGTAFMVIAKSYSASLGLGTVVEA